MQSLASCMRRKQAFILRMPLELKDCSKALPLSQENMSWEVPWILP